MKIIQPNGLSAHRSSKASSAWRDVLCSVSSVRYATKLQVTLQARRSVGPVPAHVHRDAVRKLHAPSRSLKLL